VFKILLIGFSDEDLATALSSLGANVASIADYSASVKVFKSLIPDVVVINAEGLEGGIIRSLRDIVYDVLANNKLLVLVCMNGCGASKLRSIITEGEGAVDSYILNSFIEVFSEGSYTYTYDAEGNLISIEKIKTIYHVAAFKARLNELRKPYPSTYILSSEHQENKPLTHS